MDMTSPTDVKTMQTPQLPPAAMLAGNRFLGPCTDAASRWPRFGH